MNVKVSGAWKNVSRISVNVGGVWKTVLSLWCKENGVWKNASYTLSALLHMNGSNTSTTFTDSYGKTWTAHGTAQITTAQSKFGGASGAIAGGGAYIDTPAHSDFNVTNNDFIIDFWIKRNSVGATQRIFGQCDSSSTLSTMSLRAYFGTTNFLNASLVSGTTLYNIASSIAMSDTNWHYVEFTRSGNTLYLFIDGASAGSLDVTGISANSSSNKFSIGRWGEADGTYLNAYVDEFHFVNGIAGHTSGYTPPSSEYV